MVHSVRDSSRLAASIAEFYMHGAVLGPGAPLLGLALSPQRPWNYANSPYEQQSTSASLALLPPAPTPTVFTRGLGSRLQRGVFTEILAHLPKVHRVVGVDVAQSAVRRAQARCAALDNVSLHLGDVREVPFDTRFTAAFCAETLSHMGSWHSLRSICDSCRAHAAGWLAGARRFVSQGRFLHKPFRVHRDFTLVRRGSATIRAALHDQRY